VALAAWRCQLEDLEPAIRVLIAEDTKPVREALSALVASEPGFDVVGIAADADEAIELAVAESPDVAILDVRMSRGGGPRAAGELRKRSPRTRVLALSAYEDRATVVEMLRCGAVGYLLKGAEPSEIVEAVRRSVRGQASLSVAIVARVLEDVSERVRIEEVERRSEQGFAAVVEAAPDAVVISDAGGVVVLVNAETERMFGYGREELMGEAFELLFTEVDRDQRSTHMAHLFSEPGRRPLRKRLDLRGRRKDGSEFLVEVSLGAIETDDGRLAIAFARDVSAREHEKEGRRKDDELLAAVLAVAPGAVVVLDTAGKVVLVSAQTEQMFGYSRSEILGKDVEAFIPARYHESYAGHRANYAAEPRIRPGEVGLELWGRRKGGTEFPVQIWLSAIPTEGGLLVAAFVRDMTEEVVESDLQDEVKLQAFRGRLAVAEEKERQRIASDIHDDSIQVITAAGMRLQMLRDQLEDPEQVVLLDELGETIRLSIDRLRLLIFELHPPVLDRDGLAAALRIYLEKSEDDAAARYTVEDRLTSPLPDDRRLIFYRIAQEALANVRKHAQATNVRVTLSERGNGVIVGVSDDGVGFTAGRATPESGHVGLASIRERADLAGGWLRVNSTPGEGTTVEFWIPTRETDEPVEAPA
jgi:PAS domain S-box-containing protein